MEEEDEIPQINDQTIDNVIRTGEYNARRSAVGWLDADPEQATRAMELGKASEVPPEAIYDDVEGFEKTHKSFLAGELIKNNQHLQDYINNNPMGARVSSDDWGNLDKFSQQLRMFPLPIPPNRIGQKAIDKFFEGFGEQGLGSWAFNAPQAVDYPKTAAAWALVGVPAEVIFRAFGGAIKGLEGAAEEAYTQLGGSPDEAKRFSRDIAGMAESRMFDLGQHIPKPTPEVIAKFRDASPYLNAKQLPPPRLNPEVDKVYIEQAKIDAKNLDSTLQAAQATATRERSPELLKKFGLIGTEAKIYISADAVRALYGEKEPLPEDGILGWVPGLAEQIGIEGRIGGDVSVSLAEWNAKVDKEIAKELKDHISVRADGVTLAEAEVMKEAEAAKKEQIKAEAPIVRFRKEAEEVERFIEPVQEGQTRLWRGNRVGEEGQNPSFTNDLPGIALPFREAYGGRLSYVDVPTADLAKYEATVGTAHGAEFQLPKDLASKATVVEHNFNQQAVISVKKAAGLDPLAREMIEPEAGLFSIKPPTQPTIRAQTINMKYVDVPTLGHATLEEALKEIDVNRLDSSIGPFMDDIAKRIIKSAGEIKVHVVDQKIVNALGHAKEFGDVSAFYDSNTHEIIMGEQAFRSRDGLRVIIHEGIHAATSRILIRQPAAGRIVHTLMEEVRKLDPDLPTAEGVGKYAFQNEHEFLAEALSNKRFQDRLAKIMMNEKLAKTMGLKEWRLRDIWSALVEWIGLLHNIPKGMHSALEATLRAFDFIAETELSAKNRAAYDKLKAEIEKPEKRKKSFMGGKDRRSDRDPGTLREQTGLSDAEIEDLIGVKPAVGPKEPELPGMTRMEDRPAFEKPQTLGMTSAQMKHYLEQVKKEEMADREYLEKKMLADAAKRETEEWKKNKAEVTKEVTPKVMNRPDVSTARLLSEGILYDQKVKGRPRLNADLLTDEQKAMLPEDYVKKDGINPDDAAGLLGYTSGEELINNLIAYEQAREQSGLGPKEYVKSLVDREVEAQMEARYGDSPEKILEMAQDHVTGQPVLDRLAEELVFYGTKAGSELPIKTAELKAWAKQAVGDMKLEAASLERLLKLSGKHGQIAELAGIKGRWGEAFEAKQKQFFTLTMAAEAKKVEKELRSWESQAKRLGKRNQDFPPEYTNWIHDILVRTGHSVERSVQNINEGIAELPAYAQTLKDFVDFRTNHDMASMPVWEELQNPRFQKSIEEMTVSEFRGLRDSVKTLVHNARLEQKVIKEGDARDFNEFMDKVVEEITSLPPKGKLPSGQERKLRNVRKIGLGHLNTESILNRLDKDDPFGPLNTYVARELADAESAGYVMLRKVRKEIDGIFDQYPVKDPYKRIDNKLWREQGNNGKLLDDEYMPMNRANVLGILQNMGNKSNFEKLAKAWELRPDVIRQWVFDRTTKEDWDRAQAIGRVFARLIREADRMEARQSGLPVEKIPLEPIDTPHGQYDGWYHPIKFDEYRPGDSRRMAGKDDLEVDSYFRAATPKSYQKRRTGYIAPLELNINTIGPRIEQMVQDITMREAVAQAGKVFHNPRFQRALINHYSENAPKQLMDNLRMTANAYTRVGSVEDAVNKAVNRISTNMTATLIGWNPHTLAKHTMTAAVNSLSEVGVANFGRATWSLVNERMHLNKDVWSKAMEESTELQRRIRSWADNIEGQVDHKVAMGSFEGFYTTVREKSIQYGAAPVGFFDLLSAVPTYIAMKEKLIAQGVSEGEAISVANRAVRRAHGSAAITSKPGLAVTSSSVLRSYMTLYNFFSHMLQKQYEFAWKAGEAYQGAKEFDFTAAKKHAGTLAMGFVCYMVIPAMIEEWVTPYINADKDSLGKKIVKAGLMGMSSSIIPLRDLVHSMINFREPTTGILATYFKTISDLARDISHGPTNLTKDQTGKLIQHVVALNAALTGIGSAQLGRSARFIHSVATGQEHPRSVFFGKNWEIAGGDWAKGLTRGTLREFHR